MNLRFFDANVIYGVPSDERPLKRLSTIQEAKTELTRAGIGKALIRCEEQVCAGADIGNRMIAEDIAGNPSLYGVWAILPSHTREIPGPETILADMRSNRIVAWQFIPKLHQFPFHHRVLGDWFGLAEKAKVPILVDFRQHGIEPHQLLDVLDRFPSLTVIMILPGVWPSDRMFRPFLREFFNVRVELSNYLCDGGIESLVEDYGPDRIVFGSGLWRCHPGGMMLALRHAGIPEEAKQKIASENLEQILSEIRYDQP
jgi:predicted TIM-barrel fold metal-dependent hydrolase